MQYFLHIYNSTCKEEIYASYLIEQKKIKVTEATELVIQVVLWQNGEPVASQIYHITRDFRKNNYAYFRESALF